MTERGQVTDGDDTTDHQGVGRLLVICLRVILTFPGIERRGMVVTVFCDPENPVGSTFEAIHNIEDGDVPIFGCS